jgi:tetratricopeptide (TPR) repeat protein
MMTAAFAQSEKYTKTMEALIPVVDTTRDHDALITVGNSFERIANAEKTQWLPFYYAALANINAGNSFTMDGGFGDKSADIDPLADKAEELLNKAEALSKDNSEIWVAKKMLASLKMMGNVMARFQEYKPKAEAALETAKKLNPENPRVYLLEGQDLFFTPEQFGGDKQEAKKRLETAIAKFGIFKPESGIHPNWGMPSAKYLLSEIK